MLQHSVIMIRNGVKIEPWDNFEAHVREAEDAGGVGVYRRSFRYLIPGNKSPALIAGCLHLLTGANFARGDG